MNSEKSYHQQFERLSDLYEIFAFVRDSRSVHGWPSGLRRQTQAFTYRALAVGHSGTRQGAWVQIPLRAKVCSLLACFDFTYAQNFCTPQRNVTDER